MTEPREVEAKFSIDRADRERLVAVEQVGRFAVAGRVAATQTDIYFDTPCGDLGLAGATLRVRRTAGGAKMTFKGPKERPRSADEAHVAVRLEDEVALAQDDLAGVRDDAPLPEFDHLSPRARAGVLAGGAPLLPVARLVNDRVTLLLQDEDGQALELAIDDCVGTRLSDGRVVSFDEVELESKSADRDALAETAIALRAIVPSLRPGELTKLGRTLG